MKHKNNKPVAIINKKYISQRTTSLKYKPNKKEVTFKKKLKSVKVFIPSANENALYTLRNNKVVEKKQAIKRHYNKKRLFKKPLPSFKNKVKEVLLTNDSDKLSITNGNNYMNDGNDRGHFINMSFSKTNDISNCSNSESNEINLSNSLTRSHMDARSKLKILDLYEKLKSFTVISEITGINSQTIRYWQKTKDSLKEKAKHKQLLDDSSSSSLDFEALLAQVESMLSRKALKKPSIHEKSIYSIKSSGRMSVGSKAAKTISNSGLKIDNNRSKSFRKSTRRSAHVALNGNVSSLGEPSSKCRKMNMDSNDPFNLMPDIKSLDSIVDEINKLSDIYESPDCLESLHEHFRILQSKYVSSKSYDNKSLMAKTKLQDENFKHIISDFFRGEYKLLIEINYQFNQLLKKKSKSIKKKNLEELKNYFHGSIQRLHILKHQLA